LNREDLTDLLLVRLDLIVAIEVSKDGLPGKIHLGYLLPSNGSRWSIETFPHISAVTEKPLDLIALAEEDLSKRITGRAVDGVTRALLVWYTGRPVDLIDESMEELRELARTAGIEVIDSILQPRSRPDPRYIVGQGKLRDITVTALDEGADTLIFNGELTPSQLRAITDQTELKVIDRTMLILDIFAQHARSSGGKIQVELAQLRYLLPRLVGKGTALSRLAGGIGTRGPGETKLEVDRRRIRQRITHLEKNLAKLQKGRRIQRKKRGSQPVSIVSIVGYTNVGKSTLLNTLTKSAEMAENKLFATLDPVSRKLTLAGGSSCILTDTVGIIHAMPPELERAFAATFEEIRDADLIVHLADSSHPNSAEQIETVNRIMQDLELEQIPNLLVLNKADLTDADTLKNLKLRYQTFSISALDRSSLSPLLEALSLKLEEFRNKGTGNRG
jgi:GTP-binding protein HflX